MEEVILVNESDEAIGTMEKMKAHLEGRLHRAFSVFIFNSHGEVLVQRRALSKYHSAGLWTNTCCSHPRPGEDTLSAAERRLMEEMGLECPLAHCFAFVYKTDFENGLTEHELDHVFIGHTDQMPRINPDEVHEYKYISVNQLKAALTTHPEDFTVWFKISIGKTLEYLNSK